MKTFADVAVKSVKFVPDDLTDQSVLTQHGLLHRWVLVKPYTTEDIEVDMIEVVGSDDAFDSLFAFEPDLVPYSTARTDFVW